MNPGSIRGRGKRFFSSPYRPAAYSVVTGNSYSGGKVAGV